MIVLLHGLEGSSTSHYALGMLRECRARRLRAIAVNFRSCSGELNRLPRFYHSGDTGDLDAVIRLLVEREPDVKLGIAGVSLGGNVLVKWLGEQGSGAPPQVLGAVAISVPFDLAACARVLDRGFRRRVYTANFMRTMRRKVADKARRHPAFVDVAAARRARTFAAYDRVVTAPLFGFADEVDYWTRASSGPYVARIRRPTLLISALDDPFVPAATLAATHDGNDIGSPTSARPHAAEGAFGIADPTSSSAFVRMEVTRHGGHVGFLEGPPWRASSWAERRAIQFLAEHLGAAPAVS